MRVEDIDPPREQPGATTMILSALERYGFEWDGELICQSAASAAHEAAMQRLVDEGHAYHCGCSRRDLADSPQGVLGTIYPGTCRNGSNTAETAVRVRTDDTPVIFTDALQGRRRSRLESESGDFIVWRRDGLVAYHLAVVVDDFEQGVTEIVRGIDLLDSTSRQIWLQRLLGYPTPRYVHIPVATHPDGQKLSKLSGAKGVPLDAAEATLMQALTALRQRPPRELRGASVQEIWGWAIANWKIERLVGMTQIVVDGNAGTPYMG